MESLLSLDAALRVWLASHHTPALDWVMIALSDIGARSRVWFVLGAVLVVWRPERAQGVWQMALAIGLSVLLVDVVAKPVIARMRPFQDVVDVRVIGARPNTYSFPSGHAANAFAGGMALARILVLARAPRSGRSRRSSRSHEFTLACTTLWMSSPVRSSECSPPAS